MPYNGFIFVVDEPKRAGRIKDRTPLENGFTDVISAPDWEPKKAEICFVSLGGRSLDYVGLVRRGNRVATQKYRIRFSNLYRFDPPVPFARIEQGLTSRLRQHFLRSSSGLGGRVPQKTWEALLRCVQKLRPESEDRIEHLLQLLSFSPETSRGESASRIVAQEKDSLNVALRISRFNAQVLGDWKPSTSAPFLTGLSKATISEDQMIVHDAQVFGDWAQLEKYQTGVAVFQNAIGSRLTVMNVNRHRIEETLGVDLLYYLHQYRSYVLLQYKRMKRSPNNEMEYRPTDKSYKSELNRMLAFNRDYRPKKSSKSIADYRLNSGPFYFKLCPNVILDPASITMLSGMYLPLGYWVRLVRSERTKGSRGGIRITYANAGRHLNNSLFIDLVQDGWIGTRFDSTEAVTRLVRQALEGDRSLTLAAKF